MAMMRLTGAAFRDVGSLGSLPPLRIAIATAVSMNLTDLIGKLVNPMTKEESLSLTTSRGWPSSSYYIEGNSDDTHRESLLVYAAMWRDRLCVNPYTYPSLLKACVALRSGDLGGLIHQNIVKTGLGSDVYIGASLVDMYAKLGKIAYAHRVFVELPERNVVPWTALVSGYSLSGDVDMAFLVCNEFRREGLQPNSVTVLALLCGIDLLVYLLCVHGCTIRSGIDSDARVANSLVNVYAKCGSMECAKKVFDGIQERDIVSWNSIVSGCSHKGEVKDAVEFLRQMQQFEGMRPDFQTFGSLLSAISSEDLLVLGQSIHALTISYGFESDIVVQTAVMGMYTKLGRLDEAKLQFGGIQHKDDVAWTTLISGLVLNGRANESLLAFHQMMQARYVPSAETLTSAIAACAQVCALDRGTSIHAYLIRQQIIVDVAEGNSLVTMYAKCCRLRQARNTFDRMNRRDVVSWNAIVFCYSQDDQLDEALLLFAKMKLTKQRPDSVTMVGLLQACTAGGALRQGKWIHGFIIRHDLESFVLVDTALVDMYSKCGDVGTALKCFRLMPQKDVVSWSAIIAGCGAHGKGGLALSLFYDMVSAGTQPNHVTFLALLSACSHGGLVYEGLKLYKSMVDDYGLEPNAEHCACVLDLLSRAGKMEDAYRFINSLKMSPTIDMLRILLTAGKNHNRGLAEAIVSEISMKEHNEAGNYVQLIQSYAAAKNWDVVSKMWIKMKSLGLKKSPGWSSIELQGATEIFFAYDSLLPRFEDMKGVLSLLSMEMREEYRHA